MRKSLLLLILLLLGISYMMAQQADPRRAFDNLRTREGQTFVTNVKDLIPSITVVTTKTNTAPPVGMFSYKMNTNNIIEKSTYLIKNWRKESK